MKLADYLRYTEDLADGHLDTIPEEPRRHIAQLLLSVLLRVSAGAHQTAQVHLQGMRVSTGPGVRWIPVDEEMPDADTTVLLALSNGEVEPGFLDCDGFRYVSAELIEDFPVTHWADYPEPPVVLPQKSTKNTKNRKP